MGYGASAPSRDGQGTSSLFLPHEHELIRDEAQYLFDSTSEPVGEVPKLKEGVVAFWGYEDSGFTAFGQMEAGKPLKDLDLVRPVPPPRSPPFLSS